MNNQSTVSPHSRGLIFLLCLLGLVGIAGLHNFTVGKIWWGILYFFTFGFFGIGTVIDLVRILLNGFYDSKGRAILN